MGAQLKTHSPALTESEKKQILATREGVNQLEEGKGISYKKVREWLLSIGSDKELSPPA